jgi:hypothetical protein
VPGGGGGDRDGDECESGEEDIGDPEGPWGV